MKKKWAKTQVPIHELLAARWSSRAYDENRAVEGEKILALLEAARWAPSCFNGQPWRVLVTNRFENQASWDKLYDCLDGKNRQWAGRAPVLMLVGAYRHFDVFNVENRWSAYDTGAAMENMNLQAHAMGLMTRQIGGFNEQAARQAFDISEDFLLFAVSAFGYPGADEHLNDQWKEAEAEIRSREDLQAHFYRDQWGTPFQQE